MLLSASRKDVDVETVWASSVTTGPRVLLAPLTLHRVAGAAMPMEATIGTARNRGVAIEISPAARSSSMTAKPALRILRSSRSSSPSSWCGPRRERHNTFVKRRPDLTPQRHEEVTPLLFAGLQQAAREARPSQRCSERAACFTTSSPIWLLVQRASAAVRCGASPSSDSCRRG